MKEIVLNEIFNGFFIFDVKILFCYGECVYLVIKVK